MSASDHQAIDNHARQLRRDVISAWGAWLSCAIITRSARAQLAIRQFGKLVLAR